MSNILNSATPFLMMPILTRFLSTSDYGLIATFQVLAGFVAPFTGLTIHGAIARKFYDKGENFPRYVGNCLCILFGTSLVVGGVFWVGADALGQLAAFPKEWLWAVLVISVGQFLVQVTLTVLQVQNKAVQYGICQNIQTLCNLSLSIWFVVYLGMNWQGRIQAQIIAMIVVGIAGIVVLWARRNIVFRFDWEDISSAVRFGVPLIPHAFGGWVMAASDRLFINKMVGVGETGIYSVAVQLAMVVSLIEVSFNTAWVPWLYDKLREDNPATKVKIVKLIYGYVICIFAFSILFALLGPGFLDFFVGKDFRGAAPFIFWLVIAKALEAMYYMTCNFIFYSTKTIFMAIAIFLSSTVHVIAVYSLIKLNGTIGAAQATVISSLVLVALVWWFAAKLHKMPWLLGWSR